MEDYYQIKESISNATKAIERNPTDAHLYLYRGQGYIMIGQFDKAISDYTKAIELNPMDADYYVTRGSLYFGIGQNDKAIADCTKAIDELDLRGTGPYMIRGNAYACEGQHDKAIADYTKAIEINPKASYAYNFKAWLLATCRDAEYRNGAEAVELAKKAVELNPEGYILDTLAAAYAEVGKFEDAITIQEKVIELVKREGKSNPLIDRFIERLKSYKAHKPWRESGSDMLRDKE